MDDMFRLAVEACPAAMLMVSEGGKIELVNAECELMFGYARGELIGQSIELLTPSHMKDTHKALRSGFAKNPSKRLMGVGRDLRAVRKDGSEFPVEIGLTPIGTARGLSVLAFVVDITARREAEKAIRGYLAELERANEGLARFAYVASHDIQEPLRKIVAFAGILDTAIGERNFEDLALAGEVMRDSAMQARVLVADLLTMARSLNSAYEVETVSLRTIVESAMQNLSQAIADEQAAIELAVEDIALEADRTQATLLVQNIVANALKYHKPDMKPFVRISTATPPGAAPRLCIEDEGIGFPDNRRDEIFEPFKRLHTRDEYPGAGIGLAICKTVANRHGWGLSATSTPSVGSRFEIVFSSSLARPASEARGVPIAEHAGAPTLPWRQT